MLKNSRDEAKKDLQAKKISPEVFFRYQANQQDKVVKRDRCDRAISSNKSISESQ